MRKKDTEGFKEALCVSELLHGYSK